MALLAAHKRQEALAQAATAKQQAAAWAAAAKQRAAARTAAKLAAEEAERSNIRDLNRGWDSKDDLHHIVQAAPSHYAAQPESISDDPDVYYAAQAGSVVNPESVSDDPDAPRDPLVTFEDEPLVTFEDDPFGLYRKE